MIGESTAPLSRIGNINTPTAPGGTNRNDAAADEPTFPKSESPWSTWSFKAFTFEVYLNPCLLVAIS